MTSKAGEHKKVLLKISGEALSKRDLKIDYEYVGQIVEEVLTAYHKGVDIAIVVGGGNILRGVSAAAEGADRVDADYSGMAATMLNADALRQEFRKKGFKDVRIQSAIQMIQLAEPYIRTKALHHLDNRRIVIFAGGTGCPYSTTDYAAVLRALEMKCDIVLKATNVDGIFDKDPKKHTDAKKFDRTVSHKECLHGGLKVMDSTAFALAMDNKMPIRLFDINVPGNITKALLGEAIGSLVA